MLRNSRPSAPRRQDAADARGCAEQAVQYDQARPGYDEEEVDAFLDEVEAELDRLIQENEELRAKLAEVLRGGGKPAMALSSPLSDPKSDMMMPEPPMEQPMRRPSP